MAKVITVSLTDEELDEITNYCLSKNLPRSKFMVQCTMEKIVYLNLLRSATDMCNSVSREIRIAHEQGRDSEITQDMVETFEGLVKILGGGADA